MVRAIIAERNTLLRETLINILHSWVPSLQLTEPRNGEEAMGKTETTPPDLLRINLEQDGRKILELIRRIKTRHSGTIIIAYSNFDGPEYRVGAQKQGEDYFFSQESSLEEYLELIHSIFSSRRQACGNSPKRSRKEKGSRLAESEFPRKRANRRAPLHDSEEP